MARSSRSRRRRGRLSGLYRVLSLLLICGAIVAALTLFFKIETIHVEGNSRYSDEEIIDVSGLQLGGNLFLMNKYATAADIFEKLPYISKVSITRALPSALLIEVTETEAVAAIGAEDGSCWLISPNGKLLELTEQSENALLVRGETLLEPQISKTMVLASDYKREALLSLIDALRTRNMLPEAEWIDLSDGAQLTMHYGGRFTVCLLWTSDFSYKMDSLSAIIGYLEANETGVINMTQDGKANFIPD